MSARTTHRAHPYPAAQRPQHLRRPSPSPRDDFPPSPPRSHHDSGSPPVSKSAMPEPDNYWEDVPPAPASLKSILDSFRRSGEGDRDLLMAILQAKKSEEERLTAIIQTRLTILQARLNMAAIQAQMPGDRPIPPPSAPRQERTSSMSSNPSSTASPPVPPQYYQNYSQGPERIHLPPPMGYSERERLPPLRERDDRDRRDSRESRDRRPSENAGGLEMLLEGVREAERKERI